MNSNQQIIELLQSKKIALASGLSEAETLCAEATYEFRFPPDLRELLQIALPIGKSFPNWREIPSEFISGVMAWPLDGMIFDIKHDTFWLPSWGEKPQDLDAAIEIARQAIAKAPKLIPIFGHRFLPAEPCQSGNPVFSVYQTDIIYYGLDLESYFKNEFLKQHDWGQSEPQAIDFWDAVMNSE